MKWVPYLLLAVGLALAAAHGARLGERQADYRRYAQYVAAEDSVDATVAPPREAALPGPSERLEDWRAVALGPWGVGVVMIVAGALAARRQRQAEVTATPEDTGHRGVDFLASLDAIRDEIRALRQQLSDEPEEGTAPGVRERLEGLRDQQVGSIVDARHQWIAHHGVGAFAEFFSPFSGGERLLNRAWSALTDGYPRTAEAALDAALLAFEQSEAAYRRLAT